MVDKVQLCSGTYLGLIYLIKVCWSRYWSCDWHYFHILCIINIVRANMRHSPIMILIFRLGGVRELSKAQPMYWVRLLRQSNLGIRPSSGG